MLFVATTPSSTSKADWSALLERPVVSELCSAAMLLPCAATWPSVVARAAAVARGAIAGQRAAVQLGGQLCGDSVVQGLDGRRVVAGGCRVHRQVHYLSVRRESQGKPAVTCVPSVTSPLSRTSGMLPVTGPSNMFS